MRIVLRPGLPFLVCFGLILLGAPRAAHGYLVKPDGTGDYPTIQAAIDAAGQYSVIELDDGVFRGYGNRNISFLGKQIVVTSRSRNPEACVIDAEGSELDPARVVVFTSHEGPATRLEYVTIRGGYLPPGPGWQMTIGAGIYIKQSSPSITGCIVTGNTCTGGGALMCYLDTSTIADCMITGNEIGLSGHLGNSTILRCTISDNRTFGVINLHSDMTFVDCRVLNNTSWGVAATEIARTDLTSCLVMGNQRGGLFNRDESWMGLTGCRVLGNAGPAAAGLWSLDSSTLLVTDTIVAGNHAADGADSRGGGVRVDDGNVTVSGCSILGNEAPTGGGFYAESSNVTIERTLFDANCAHLGGPTAYFAFPMGSATIGCSALDSADVVAAPGVALTYTSEPVSADPLLCDRLTCEETVASDQDVTVAGGSPCLPGESPCGERIGAGDLGCTGTPVEEASWGHLKSLFHDHD